MTVRTRLRSVLLTLDAYYFGLAQWDGEHVRQLEKQRASLMLALVIEFKPKA
jgi:hypothetical protein